MNSNDDGSVKELPHQLEDSRRPAWVTPTAWLIRRLPLARYFLAHRCLPRPSQAFWANTPRQLGGFQFFCDLRSSIEREVCFTGQYEPQETLLVRSLLKPAMTFVDVGANWGYFTLLASAIVGPQGAVVSVEPQPEMFRILEANIARNQFRQASATQVAASDQDGTAFLVDWASNGDNRGTARLAPISQGHRVVTCRLDTLLAERQIDHVHLLKMDIEGAEGSALAGLQRCLREQTVDRILLELHPTLLAQTTQNASLIARSLLECGYSGYTVDHSPRRSRLAAYGRVAQPNDLLGPLHLNDLDRWPHQLWLSPRLNN